MHLVMFTEYEHCIYIENSFRIYNYSFVISHCAAANNQHARCNVHCTLSVHLYSSPHGILTTN